MRDYDKLSREELIRLLLERDGAAAGGIRLTYPGQTAPWQIVRRVQPRAQKIEKKLSCGDEAEQAENLIVEGENLQALVSLYKYRGHVDLVLTDPPYNTGLDFRYNDKWDVDPNDPDLGTLVPTDDGSRHSKWLRFMKPRLWVMKEMLRPGGVLAICIDQRELYRLGLLLDELFGEANRVGIINWQKSYAPRNDRKHISTTTEYVLVYAKDIERSKTGLLPRTDAMNARYLSPDGDPRLWKPGDLTARGADTHKGMVYAVQSPFTGELHYPSEGRHWGSEKKRMKAFLQAWGSQYVERDLNDGKALALMIKGAPLPGEKAVKRELPVLKQARKAAEAIRAKGNWPAAHWRDEGQGTFGMKKYLEDVKKGIVPTTFWADEDYEEPFEIGNVSWEHEHSGHSQAGINELSAIVGRSHGFDTVKPLRLFKKIIQIWCPPSGIVLDPFAGSGTTAHAVLEVNNESSAERRFILIEQGRPERGDPYARSLTAVRVKHAITGERVTKQGKIFKGATPLPGGFRFSKLMSTVDAAAVLALEREEMIDLLLTSHWDQNERSAAHLHRLPVGTHEHLFAKSPRGEGYFLIWNGPDEPSVLNRTAFRAIAREAAAEGLSQPFHVYARISTYSGPNTEFYQIPNRILEKLGFNEAVHLYGTAKDEQPQATENAA
ncbi:site-specific DNA-methyltransferase [Microvirga brassicacearum]|uniref:site-specific DNA-methyltransferase (adenine-specific) n=1 Tax=Microvirga brassicacearum TaxID=2580413 RepID=A0A5N3PFG7_9HYPH|nr:site-specific DNA-methyltransferase [Microvirga brassicacearum]KAB0268476.1 site-specific DNA-methyltransferase [Microvirga brassicacearum]